MINSKIASLEARLTRLEGKLMSKKAGHQMPDPALVKFQIKTLLKEGAYQLEGFEVKALSPLSYFPATHAIRIVCINDQGNSVVLDLHCSNNVIVGQTLNVFDHMYNTKVVYNNSNEDLGGDFIGEDLTKPSTVRDLISLLQLQ
jgi:hypothetical protein